MADDRREVSIMQYLDLDYGEAIKSTDAFIKRIDDLNKALDSIGADMKTGSISSAFGGQAIENAKQNTDKLAKSFDEIKVYTSDTKLSMTELYNVTNNLKKVDADRVKEARNFLSNLKQQVEAKKKISDDDIEQLNVIQKMATIQKEIAQTERQDVKKQDYVEQLQSAEQILVLQNQRKIASLEVLAVEERLDDNLKRAIQNNKEITESIAKRVEQGEYLTEQDRKLLENSQLELNLIKQKIELNKQDNRVGQIAEEKKHIQEMTVARQLERTATLQQKAERQKLNDDLLNQIKNEREILSLIQQQVGASGTLTAEQQKQVEESKRRLDKIQSEVNISSNDILRKSTTFSEELKRRVGWFVSGQLWYGLVEGSKNAVKSLKDIESGMVDIGRVVRDVNFDTVSFRDELMKLGQEYGFTFNDMQPIALRWAQSGYNVQDTLELTKNSLLALNVAELDAKESTESLIAIMQQWNLQAKDSELVIDKINKTADSFAVTSQDLVDGLMKSSSAARNMNVTFDELLGLLTATKEASGATGKEVGNALRSIMAYVQRDISVNTLAGVGIDVFADAQKTQFRSILDIFKDIKAHWGTMSKEIQDGFVKSADDAGLFNEELANALDLTKEFNDVQKRDISQASAGVFRRNYFISLIENLTQAENVMNNLKDVAGYSAKENAQAMDTMVKKSKQLENSWEQLIIKLGDSGLVDAFKVAVDGANSFLEAINKISTPLLKMITTFGLLQVSLKTLKILSGEVGNAFKRSSIADALSKAISKAGRMKEAFNEAKKSGVSFGEASEKVGLKLQGVHRKAKHAREGIEGVKIASQEATKVATGFTMSLGSMINLGLTAVTVIYSLVQGYKSYREEQERAILQRKQELKQSEEDYNNLIEKYKEFVELEQKTSSTTATQEDRKALRDIQYELAGSLDGVATALDNEGKKYIENSQVLADYIKLKKEELDFNKQLVKNDMDKNLEKDMEILEKYPKQIDAINKYIAKLNKEKMQYLKKGGWRNENAADYMQELIEEQQSTLKKLTEDYNKARKNSVDRMNEQIAEVENFINKQEEQGKKISQNKRNIIMKLTENKWLEHISFLELPNKLEEITNMSDKELNKMMLLFNTLPNIFNKKLNTDKLETSIKEMETSNKALANSFKILDAETLEANRNFKEHLKSFDEANNIYRDSEGRILALSSSQLELSLEVQRLGKEYEELEKIQQQLNSTGHVTAEQMEVLKRIFPDLAEKTGLEESAIIALVNTATSGYAKYIMANINLTQAAKDGSNARIAMIQNELNAWLGLVTGIGAVNRTIDDNIKSVDISGDGDMSLNERYNPKSVRRTRSLTNQMTSEADRAKSVVENLIKSMDKYKGAVGGVGKAIGNTAKASRGGAKASREENKALQDALKTLEQRKKLEGETFATAKRDLEELIKIKKQYAKTYDEQMDMDIRIMEQEKKYFSLRLQFSKNWIEEQKRLRIMNTQDEIDAWERIKSNQADNIEAMKEAEIQLYELRNKLRDEQIAKEERYINLRRNIGLSDTQYEIDAYESIYKQFGAKNQEEEFSRIENLYGLYHKRVDELFKDIDKAHNDSIKQMENNLKSLPMLDELKDLENQRRELVKLQKQADKLKDLTEVGKRLRALRNEAKELGMDTRGLFAELPSEYLKLLDGELTGLELLENAHKARLKFLEEESKRKAGLKQKEIDDIERQIKALDDLEKAENKEDRLAKLKEELAYWKVRTSEEARKKVKELEEEINKFERDDRRQTEKDKLKSMSDRLKDEKKQLEDDFSKRKKRLEDEYNIERRVKEEIGKLNRNEKSDKIRYQIEMLDARKNSLEEEKRMIEERAREEIEFRKNQYEQLKNGFNEHATQIVALAGTLSKDAYNEWMQNYVLPLQNAVSRGDYREANDISRRGNAWLQEKDRSNREYFTRPNVDNRNNNREIYSLVERIVQLKYDWDNYRKNGNEEAAHRANLQAIELRKRLARFNPSLASQLANSNYYQAMQILTRLPKMHSGGKTLSYGAVYMKPGELVFPPNLSSKLEHLIGFLDKTNFKGSSVTNNNDTRSSTINISSLLTTDRIDFRDRTERDDVVRQIMKNLKSIANK